MQDVDVYESKIKMDLQEIRWNDAVWIHLAEEKCQGRGFVNMVMHFRVP